MGKFLRMMSQNDSSTLRRRAGKIDIQARNAMSSAIRDLEDEKVNVELQIQDLTDFAPETTDALRPGCRGWDPQKWSKNLLDLRMKLYTINLKLKNARDTFAEFFENDDDEAETETTTDAALPIEV